MEINKRRKQQWRIKMMIAKTRLLKQIWNKWQMTCEKMLISKYWVRGAETFDVAVGVQEVLPQEKWLLITRRRSSGSTAPRHDGNNEAIDWRKRKLNNYVIEINLLMFCNSLMTCLWWKQAQNTKLWRLTQKGWENSELVPIRSLWGPIIL